MCAKRVLGEGVGGSSPCPVPGLCKKSPFKIEGLSFCKSLLHVISSQSVAHCISSHALYFTFYFRGLHYDAVASFNNKFGVYMPTFAFFSKRLHEESPGSTEVFLNKKTGGVARVNYCSNFAEIPGVLNDDGRVVRPPNPESYKAVGII